MSTRGWWDKHFNYNENKTVFNSDNENEDLPVDLSPILEDITHNETSSILPSVHCTGKLQKELVNDFVNSVELDLISDQPVNEFKTQYLATMVFPTLFPDGKGDPTNNVIVREITSSELDLLAYKIKSTY